MRDEHALGLAGRARGVGHAERVVLVDRDARVDGRAARARLVVDGPSDVPPIESTRSRPGISLFDISWARFIVLSKQLCTSNKYNCYNYYFFHVIIFFNEGK